MFIIEPLFWIFNNILSCVTFPNLFKKTVTTMTFKNGETENSIDYRPISITLIFSKILENILLEKIISFTNKLINIT